MVTNSISPPFGCYQITLLGGRGTCVCVWTTWTESLCNCNCNCNWGTCIVPPTRRPRAHHRVNLYTGAHRQNETKMFADHDETSPSLAAVSAPSALGSLFHACSTATEKALLPIHRRVRGTMRLPHNAQCRSTWNIGDRCQKVWDTLWTIKKSGSTFAITTLENLDRFL